MIMFKKTVTVFTLINLLLLAGSISALAKPQPDFTFWGTAHVNGVPLTQSDTDHIITLEVDGIELVQYTMGDMAIYEDYYVLKVPMDDDPMVVDKGQAGDTAFVYINGNPVDENPLTLGNYGETVLQDIYATIAVLEPEIDVSPMSLDYGDVFISSSSSLSVTIANTGTADLDVTSIALGAGTSTDFAITSGPASVVVAPGANVTVEVTYSPLDEGTDSGTLVIDSNDTDEPVVTVSLSGNGVPEPVPEIDVSPMSLDYGVVFIGSSSSLSVTIENIGSADLDVTSIALGAGTSADFAIAPGPASIVLAPGANVTVEVTYSPSDEDTDSGTLVIDSDDADEPVVTVSLIGNGVPVPVAEIDVSPMSLDYGDVFIGSSSSLSVTIANIGSADLDVTSIALGAATSADFAIAPGPASIVLAPGANVTVEVTYSPSDLGPDSGTLVIDSNDADEPTVTVSLFGNGVPVPVPEIDVVPLSLNYGDVFIGSDSAMTVTITNMGTADLDVTSIALGVGTSGDFAITSGPTLPVSVVPGANVIVQVTYSPSDEGTDSGTLVIESNDADEPVVTVSLFGNGVPEPVPEIDVSPMSLNYGDVLIGSSLSLSVTIANTGTADLDVTSIALGAGSSADFAITSGPESVVVAPGANVTVEVTYSPTDEGTDSGTLVIESDDADEPVVTVSLSGNGVPVPVPEIEVSPLTLDYGDVFLGASLSKTVTISNVGTANLDVTSIGLGAGSSLDFEVTSGPSLPVSVVPGANVSVQVTYSPIDEDADSGTLVIESNDTDEAVVTVSLSGNGVPEPVPEIDVSPMSLDYGDVFIGSDLAIAVTIKNIGTADLDVTSIALGAATSADFAITSGPASITLVPGANVTVQVTYSAFDEGTDSGTLEIESDDADEPVVIVSLSGNGVPEPVPEIDVTPMALDYGDVFIGSSSSFSVTIANIGNADLDVTSIGLGAGSSLDFEVTSGLTSIVLVPGANTTVQVTYSPSEEDADSGTLVIDSDDADEPVVTVSLFGNGVPVPVPEIDVNPMSLDYGDVFTGSSSSLSVTITNIGTADLDVTNIALGVGTSADFAIAPGPASIVLVPGANVTVEVTYSPSDVDADSGTLVIDSNDTDEPVVTVSLIGNGVPVPVAEIDVSPMSLDYGDVFIGSSSSLSVTIANIGSADLDVTSIALGAGTSGDFAITSGPASIVVAPGANTTVEVAYSPSDYGADSGTLVIESDDADEPEVTVSLSGNGVPAPPPDIDVSPMSLEYGDVFIGSSSSLSVTITNTGTADLEVTDIALGTGTNADFAITSGPASVVVAPGANVTVEVTYSPSDEGPDSGTLVIESDDEDEPVVTVSLFGTGVLGPSVLEVDIDIKPGSSTNPINLKSKGKVPVAILSRPTFDATAMDRDTVLFAGAPALDIGRSPKDVDGDGLPDIVLHFEVQDLDIDPEDTELCLTGSTISGQEVKGCDTVKIISK